MNIFSAILHEEHRYVSKVEEGLKGKFKDMQTTNVLKKWLKGAWICGNMFKKKKKQKEIKQEAGDDREGVNMINDRMKEMKKMRNKAKRD